MARLGSKQLDIDSLDSPLESEEQIVFDERPGQKKIVINGRLLCAVIFIILCIVMGVYVLMIPAETITNTIQANLPQELQFLWEDEMEENSEQSQGLQNDDSTPSPFTGKQEVNPSKPKLRVKPILPRTHNQQNLHPQTETEKQQTITKTGENTSASINKEQTNNSSLDKRSKWEQQANADKKLYAYQLFTNPQNESLLSEEHQRYNALYRIDQLSEQLPLCVTIVGSFSKQKYKNMLESVVRQNYTNYHLVVIDHSDKQMHKKVKRHIKETLGEGMVELIHKKNQEDLISSRDEAVRGYCNEGEIVIEVSGEDFLIGNQAFRVVNSFYQRNQEQWILYTNQIEVEEEEPKMNEQLELAKDMFAHTPEASSFWRQFGFKSYKKQLYDKLSEHDISNFNTQFTNDENVVKQALLQLSGKQHTFILNQPIYYKETRQAQTQEQISAIIQNSHQYVSLETIESEAEKVIGEPTRHKAKKHKKKSKRKEKVENLEQIAEVIEQNEEDEEEDLVYDEESDEIYYEGHEQEYIEQYQEEQQEVYQEQQEQQQVKDEDEDSSDDEDDEYILQKRKHRKRKHYRKH